jgi:lysozyme family protein
MKDNFLLSLKYVLEDEGGNVDDPEDHGGRTSRGITQKEYDAWCEENHKPMGDVWKAPQNYISMIYLQEYWDPFCDDMPLGIDYTYFDMAVNTGPHQAAKLLQRTLGVTTDGRIGPVTRRALRNCDSRMFIERYTIVKSAFYHSLHQPRFLRGWLNRDRDVRANALSMFNSTNEANV